MFPVPRLSIPRWLLIAMAALLAVAILVIVVHPYYDVDRATLGEGLMTLLLAIVQVLVAGVVCLLVVLQPVTVKTWRRQPLPVVERNCIRRI